MGKDGVEWRIYYVRVFCRSNLSYLVSGETTQEVADCSDAVGGQLTGGRLVEELHVPRYERRQLPDTNKDCTEGFIGRTWE